VLVLSISRVALGGEDYYLATAGGGRDHFEGLVEASGLWLGTATARLGLVGNAEPLAVRQLLRGLNPLTRELLLQEPGRRQVAAYDCTFSVPKSVSLLYAFSPDANVTEQIRLAHEGAVRASLRYLEEEAGVVRLPGVEARRVHSGELLAVGFLHRLSRAGDPHLHTHVLVANIVPDATSSGGRPLDATALFLECRTAGALYETHVRYELTQRLDVEWQPLDGRVWSDLKGLDRAVIRDFSQRSTQIEAGLEATGWQGGAARRAMAELTRPPKDLSHDYEDVIDGARERLWSAGVTETRLSGICYRRPPGMASPSPDADGWQEEALRRLGGRTVDGTFTIRDAIRARCATAPEGQPVSAVQADARALLGHDQVIARGARPARLQGGAAGSIPVGRLEATFTTLQIAAAEEAILSDARRLEADRPGAVTTVAYGPGERGEALASLSAATAFWRQEGRSVVGVAPGRWAAAALESACGIDTVVVPGVARDAVLRTSAELSGRSGRPAVAGVPIGPGSVVVVAEAHAYGPVALGDMMGSCVTAQASVVLVAPRSAVERRHVLADLAELGDRGLPRLLAGARNGMEVSPEPPERYVFGSVAVAVVPSLQVAEAEAAKLMAAARGPGAHGVDRGGAATPALLVAGDEALVGRLRCMPGVEAADVVHTRELTARLASCAPASPHLVVVGAAAVLRQGATAGAEVARSHVLVAPGIDASSPEGRGRAAEAARPRYLISLLGAPPATPIGRRAWREAAVEVEAYRERWRVTDVRQALGPAPLQQEGGERRLDAGQARERSVLARLAAEVRGLERERPGRELEPLGLGIGR
jgi:conjugative relaxase-like TrwC/TraI family protein